MDEDDIIEQMRQTGLKMSKWPQWREESVLMRKGADEIERLRSGICKAGVFMDQKAPGLAKETLQELVSPRLPE